MCVCLCVFVCVCVCVCACARVLQLHFTSHETLTISPIFTKLGKKTMLENINSPKISKNNLEDAAGSVVGAA